MLSRQGITAAAGTFLARDSNRVLIINSTPRTNFTATIAFTTKFMSFILREMLVQALT